jgi:hypothetical protein
MQKKASFFLLIKLLFLGNLFAQKKMPMNKKIKQVSYHISVMPLHANLYAHDKALQQFKGVTGAGFQIDLNRYRTDEHIKNRVKTRYNSGFSLQFVQFNNAHLGYAINGIYFIEPFLFSIKNFSLRLRAAGGLNYASNPWHLTRNPENKAYSWHLNGYLGLGLHAHYALNANHAVYASATYGHFSNGNTNNPNFGVNYPFLGLGYERKLVHKSPVIKNQLWYKQHWRFDLGLMASNKSLSDFKNMRFWTYGFMANASYRTGNLHAFTIGLEAFKDESMDFALQKHNVYYAYTFDVRMLGLLGGHEFLFNRMIFSQQLGYYLHNEIPKEFVGRLYHRFGINYKLNKHLMLGLNLNSNMQKAYIFDARMLFSFYK